MKILALDLGSLTGWAFTDGTSIEAGTWELASVRNIFLAKKLRMDRRLDVRASSLWSHLETFNRNGRGAECIVFEDVKFASSQAQAHLWASFRGVIWGFAHARGLEIDCLDTSRLKKFATGSGSSKKDQMAAALIQKYPNRYRAFPSSGAVVDSISNRVLDNNAVDALHLLDWANNLFNK